MTILSLVKFTTVAGKEDAPTFSLLILLLGILDLINASSTFFCIDPLSGPLTIKVVLLEDADFTVTSKSLNEVIML